MRVGKESRTFSVRIKHQGVSYRRKLGRHPRLTLAEARRLAREELQRIEFGVVVSQVESQDAALTMGEVSGPGPCQARLRRPHELWKDRGGARHLPEPSPKMPAPAAKETSGVRSPLQKSSRSREP